MTPDAAGFFRTILDHPDDDAPRLIYAAWLEDRGESIGSRKVSFDIARSNQP